MKAIGIDIGTTTICSVLIDADSGTLLDAKTLSNDSTITENEGEWEHKQSPEKIAEKCTKLAEGYLNQYEDIESIGLTGQMHGIVYVDALGNAVSPLYTWRDGRGTLPIGTDKGSMSYVEELTEKTGYPMASGFGLTTHYYQMKNGKVPKTAVSICTIADYVGMVFTGKSRPLIHQSMAASMGAFDLEKACFDIDAIGKAGIDPKILPNVTKNNEKSGTWKKTAVKNRDIIVSVALGDNQASFLGSVGWREGLLVNVGTGSQISSYSKHIVKDDCLESRPYLEDSWLVAGSPLCGGYSYSLMKRFVDEIFEMSGVRCEKSVYEMLNESAKRAYDQKSQLVIDTRFNGSRKEPYLTGSICGLTPDSFHVGQFALGILKGICKELYQYYERFPEQLKTGTTMVGSGNGIRRNPLLQQIFCERFDKDIEIAPYEEEAGYGAARFSLLIRS